MSQSKHLGMCAIKVSRVVNKEGFVEKKCRSLSSGWIGLIPHMATMCGCGSVVAELSIKGVILGRRVCLENVLPLNQCANFCVDNYDH